jgi:UDP:flavonoid glycosyltransferase YjiC (YdhE family)
MNILILALGSRGDVLPYVTLAKALKQAGHTVRVATPLLSSRRWSNLRG